MDTKRGIFGTIATLVMNLIAWTTRHDAELRAILLLGSLFLTAMMIAWWVRKWWRSQFHPKAHRPERERPHPRPPL